MNLIKSQPAAVLKFADACPFASANLNLNALKAFSNMSSGSGKIVDLNNNDKSNLTSTADADDAPRRERSPLKPKVQVVIFTRFIKSYTYTITYEVTYAY